MATTYKVLGQVNPAATTLTDLETVPAATQVVISTITVANLGSVTDTFRIAVRPAGEAIANKHYISYGATINAGDTKTLTIGITLAATDVVSVWAGTADLAFNAFGSEIA
jgi:hypothetical protein